MSDMSDGFRDAQFVYLSFTALFFRRQKDHNISSSLGIQALISSEIQSLVHLEFCKPRVENFLAARKHCFDFVRMCCIQNFECKSS